MRLATVLQAQEIDKLSQEVYGLTSEVLMESAGATAAREIDLAYFPELKRGMTAVVCGPGHNGGDGLVLARHLHSSGHRDLYVFFFAPESKRSELFKIQLKRAELQGLRIVDLQKHPEKLEQLRSASLLVDALFGIGLNRKIEDEYLQILELMNSAKAPVISLDCPSGLNCDQGTLDGYAIKASMTLTFGLAKPGFFVNEGPSHVGKLRILSIGFPFEALRGIATTHFLFSDKLARRYLPRRKETSNKSMHGHLLVVAGSEGHWGAGVLASAAAYRMGVGYVTWASFESPSDQIKEAPEILTAKLSDPDLWTKKFSAVVVGPGLGVSRRTADLIERLKTENTAPVILDADALTTCVEFDLFPLPASWIVTPHSGELSRILKIEAREIDKNRFKSSLAASEAMGCHVLLKGFRSLIAFKGRSMVIHSGNSALAKAGTGDVLSGMIGALLAQGLETLQASATAAYIHGRIADEWVRVGNDRRSLLASDLKDHLPQLLQRISLGHLL